MNSPCKKCAKCCSNLNFLDCFDISLHTKTLMFAKKCRFLTNNNLCFIYKNRPLLCKKWECEAFNNERKKLYCNNLCGVCPVCDVGCKQLLFTERITISIYTKSIMFNRSCKFIGTDGLCTINNYRPQLCNQKCKGEADESR